MWTQLRFGAAEVTGQLMTASDGQIATLGIQFHREGKEVFLPVFRQMLAGVAPGTLIEVVVADEVDERILKRHVAAWFGDDAPLLHFSHTGVPITSWMRDRLAVIETQQGVRLLAPSKPMIGSTARIHDWKVPWTLAEAMGTEVRLSELRFDGGDLIADRRRAYVVPEMMRRNPDRSPAGVVLVLEKELGRPVMALQEPAPAHHIGMFLTPLGDGRVAVGDPDLAMAAWCPEGECPESVAGARIDTSDAALEPFRSVSRQLIAAGIDVVPIPVLPGTDAFTFVSYNNVVIERRSDGLHVILPVYGDEVLDAAGVAAWKALGATVHPVDVAGVFQMGGSVRCLSAPLTRVHSAG
jgi:hypothetical protein